jgi:hypothetical protein
MVKHEGEVAFAGEVPVSVPPATLAEVRKLAASAGAFLPADAGVGMRTERAGVGLWMFPEVGIAFAWGEVRA